MKTDNVYIGSDPEVFVQGKNGFYSGHVFECGTKEHPLKTPNGSVQVDGLALECNVSPSRTRTEFISNINAVLQDLNVLVKTKDPEASIRPVPTVVFGKKYLQTLPAFVRELGCNPDYCGWTMKENRPPNGMKPFRTGGGHIHVGWRKPEEISMEDFYISGMLAKEMDYYLGLPSLEWDADKRRRSLYGKAGAFRPKTYGMEYRPLSNVWLSSENLMGLVFDQTMKAVKSFDTTEALHKRFGKLAQKIINGSKVQDFTGNAELREAVYAC